MTPMSAMTNFAGEIADYSALCQNEKAPRPHDLATSREGAEDLLSERLPMLSEQRQDGQPDRRIAQTISASSGSLIRHDEDSYANSMDGTIDVNLRQR
jgi:hypothetical protein